MRGNRKWWDVRGGEEGKGNQNKERGIELDWELRVGLSLWMSKLSLMRSSWVIDEEEWERMVKSSDVVGWPVSWWCDRMFGAEELTRSLPVRAEIPKWSAIYVWRSRLVWPTYDTLQHRHLKRYTTRRKSFEPSLIYIDSKITSPIKIWRRRH